MRIVLAFCFGKAVNIKRERQNICTCVPFSRKLQLQPLQGSAINKILNIPQCTLPPHPFYQTLLFNFSRVWFQTRHMVTPGIYLPILVDKESAVGVATTEKDRKLATLKAVYCKQLRLRDAKCTQVTICEQDSKTPIKLSLWRLCTPTWPDLIALTSLPVKPHTKFEKGASNRNSL